MANLQTTYLGLPLENPFIVGSCSLSRTVDGIVACAKAGAGAVVMKSLFEEQIRLDFEATAEALAQDVHPEALAYLQADLAAHHGPREYLEVIRQAAKKVSIPIIASVNCTGPSTWVTFAEQIAAAGAAALELNVYVLPSDPETASADIEKVYLDIVTTVRRQVGLPLAIKLVPYFTNPTRLAHQLAKQGAGGLVLFNRLWQPDIDVETEALAGGISTSAPGEYRLSLRWIARLAGEVPADLCASTGVHDGESAVRLLLAGAQAVQVTSALYQHGRDHLKTLTASLERWMDEHGHADLASFRGALSRKRQGQSDLYDRSQYIKAFVGVE
jgi:dihydroorotate dehydrogenase (fumarate)